MVDGRTGMRLDLFDKITACRSLFLLRNLAGSFLNFLVLRKALFEVYILKSRLLAVLQFLKLSTILSCKTLSDIAVTDFVANTPRFKLSYNFMSHTLGSRILLSAFTQENEFVATITGLFSCAN
jgi:NADH:ubiquinone oxidoreductase subunit C